MVRALSPTAARLCCGMRYRLTSPSSLLQRTALPLQRRPLPYPLSYPPLQNKYLDIAPLHTRSLSALSFHNSTRTGSDISRTNNLGSQLKSSNSQSRRQGWQDGGQALYLSSSSESSSSDSNQKEANKEEVLEKREQLKAELKKRLRDGPFKHVRSIKSIGEQVFPTPEKLLAKKNSVKLPATVEKLETLANTTVHIPHSMKPTVLMVGFNQTSFEMLQSWRYPIEREFQPTGGFVENCPFQLLEVSVTESWVQQLMKGFLRSMLKRSIPFERHSQVVGYYGSFDKWKSALAISTPTVGHVFLIDRKGRIRWRATGQASLNDAVLIVENLTKLVDEDSDNS